MSVSPRFGPQAAWRGGGASYHDPWGESERWIGSLATPCSVQGSKQPIIRVPTLFLDFDQDEYNDLNIGPFALLGFCLNVDKYFNMSCQFNKPIEIFRAQYTEAMSIDLQYL